MSQAAIQFSGITVQYPGVVALDDVSFDVAPGTVHAVCGENGAGKSTLGKVLSGIVTPNSGTTLLDGRAVHFTSPRSAMLAGVSMVHQELAFCENLTVAENLCLGAMPSRRGMVQWAEMAKRADDMMRDLGGDGDRLDVMRPMRELSIAEQQMVQIAAAVGSGARYIIFDEPTSSLGEGEAERLYALIGRLKARGVTQLYVSHRMPEIFRLCDTVTVLRDGRHIDTRPINALDEPTLVQLMIGRRLDQYYARHADAAPGQVQVDALRVDGLTSPGRFHDISFSVRPGEVVGLAGLVGAGRSEVAQAIFGLDPEARGQVKVAGRAVSIRTPQQAMRLGIGLVPEDRKKQGVVLSMKARENTTLPILERVARFGFVQRTKERVLAADYAEKLRLRATAAEAPVMQLSGGNQQKIVLAKWLAAQCRILMLDEPTRGVDVGAKADLHAWIDRLAGEGVAIVLISSELPELLNLSTRILVLREGRLVGELPRAQATQDALLRLMAGLTTEAAWPETPRTPTSS
ncbi:MAG: sugar ABC transporter ATP-binding protein [Gemmatimonadaceae bacterium]